MFSLSVKEKLDAERDRNKPREQLWVNLHNKQKKDRMLHRIYNKTRTELADSCRRRRGAWITTAAGDPGHWGKEEPEPSVHQHTFRDRQPKEEIGPSNGHISGRKYIPRAVYMGGGSKNEEKTAELMKTLEIPCAVRGNYPEALHNPCRHTVIISD
ncbi:unnamed protein product, partial [Discosporangium mesarthrocarpum]